MSARSPRDHSSSPPAPTWVEPASYCPRSPEERAHECLRQSDRTLRQLARDLSLPESYVSDVLLVLVHRGLAAEIDGQWYAIDPSPPQALTPGLAGPPESAGRARGEGLDSALSEWLAGLRPAARAELSDHDVAALKALLGGL